MAGFDSPLPLDPRDPNFTRDARLWAFQTQCEMHELVLATREMLAATKVMMAEADRILARK